MKVTDGSIPVERISNAHHSCGKQALYVTIVSFASKFLHLDEFKLTLTGLTMPLRLIWLHS